MKNLILKVQSEFKAEVLKKEKKQIWLKIGKENLLSVCIFMKNNNFIFFSSLSAVDILKKNIIELIYHIWSEEKKMGLNIKTEISRKNLEISSISKIYNSSQIHEREIHELFGVNFLRNPNLSNLFLENWTGPPPFLKDFNWRNYVREKFYNKENKNEKGYFNEIPNNK